MSHYGRMLVSTTEVAAHGMRALQASTSSEQGSGWERHGGWGHGHHSMSQQELKVHEIVFFVHMLMLPICYWLGKRLGRKHRAIVLSGKPYTDGCCSDRMAAYLIGMLAAGLFGFFASFMGFKHGEAQAVREYRHAHSEDVPEEFMTAAEAQVQYMPPQAVPMSKRTESGDEDAVIAMPATGDDPRVDVYMAESSASGGEAASQSKPLLQV